MKRMKRVSDFAEPFVDLDDEDTFSQERGPRFRSRPVAPKPTPLLARVLASHDEACMRMTVNNRAARWWLLRTILAFVLSECPLPNWAGILFFWITMACGLITLNAWREYRIARIVTSIWPD
jgi:hypothetical protein